MILLDVHYGGAGQVETYLHCRGGELVDGEFLPYVYLLPHGGVDKGELPRKGVAGVEEVSRRGLSGEVQAWKVKFKHPKYVNVVREKLEELGELRESHIPFVRRYMIDRQLKPLTEVTEDFRRGEEEVHELRVLAFDIECIARDEITSGNNPIIMVSLWGDGLEKVIGNVGADVEGVTRVEGEGELIREFLRTVDSYKPEVVVGYNSDSFDWPTLRDRAKEHKVPLEVGGRAVSFVRRGRGKVPRLHGAVNVDLYTFIRNVLAPYMESENLALDTVARELVGASKVEIGGADGINRAWQEDPQLLYEYSLEDARITYLLAKEVLPMLYALAKEVGQTVFDVARMSPGQVVEWLLIGRAFREGMMVPNRPDYQEAQQRRALTYKGAYVKDPLTGLHSPVAVCDFRSLYPTIIMAHNISPETVGCGHAGCSDNKSPTGTQFCRREEGFVPKTLRAMFEERMGLKKRLKELDRDSHEFTLTYTRQNALKLLLNSFYGYMGYSNARWYNLESAQAITSWSRHYMKQAIESAEEAGFTVIYGDTDSVMLTSESGQFKRDVKKWLGEVNDRFPGPMSLDLEGFFVRGVFVTKKRYALMRADGSLVVKGLELVRRDWSDLARDAQEEVIRMVLRGEVTKAKEYVKGLVRELRSGEVELDRLVMRMQLTKKIENYKQLAPHVRVAQKLEAMGENVFPGMLVEYVVTPGMGRVSDRAQPASVAKEYDADYYIDKQLLPSVMRVLEAVGAEERVLRQKQSGLDKFF